jgi:hypothetical protein
MKCNKCGSSNIQVVNQTEIKTKHRGCLGWCLWIILAMCTFGLILIIPILTNSKVKSKNKTVLVCMDCGSKRNI